MHVASIKLTSFRSRKQQTTSSKKQKIKTGKERNLVATRLDRGGGFIYLDVLEHAFVAGIRDDVEHIVGSDGNREAGVDLTEGAGALRDCNIGELPWILGRTFSRDRRHRWTSKLSMATQVAIFLPVLEIV
jgi:hypothetical protein